MARKIFHSRTKTKKISRHVFHHHKPRFLRTIFVFLSPCRLRGQSLLARTSVCDCIQWRCQPHWTGWIFDNRLVYNETILSIYLG
ncbi:DUF1661 domain-containing protein [Porphyromonas gulae]|uniref:DUF1661 domain-containing protein n=1 Tax=Porphyromonas gulae TaxID=111105 RepID=UPI00374469A4